MWNSIKSFYWRYERHISSLGLIGGFIFDAVTLKQVDQLIDNLWVVAHLLVVGIGIILLNINGWDAQNNARPEGKGGETSKAEKIHFLLIFIIQFAFGGLLSTFLVFYFRSATLSASWPFLVLLSFVFAGNEIFKHHYSRLTFQTTVLFVSIFSFAIYILPITLHRIGDGIFILSGLISLFTIALFIYILRYISRERFNKSWLRLIGSIGGIYIAINVLYFANLIPPLPLSLKSAGVYHSLVRNSAGNYIGTAEPTDWKNFFIEYNSYYEVAGDPVYAYTAIYSPAELNTSIIHEWQYYDLTEKKWVTVSKITLPITGGREGGYRTYSTKSAVFPADWRVNVLTANGLYLGRIKFAIKTATTEPDTVTEML